MFKFLREWFSAPNPRPDWFEGAPLRNQYVPVPKWTHPGKQGKTIYCPKCHDSVHVKSFSWQSLTCCGCETKTIKYQWLLKND
jgi:hypothetical protein